MGQTTGSAAPARGRAAGRMEGEGPIPGAMGRLPGTYILLLTAHRATRVEVGRLGELAVRPGTYLYVGSAFGPGGVTARVGRHARGSGSRHWHIDALRPATRLAQVWYSHDGARREHEWAAVLAATPGAAIPLPGFGASDCRCPSHLFHFEAPPSLQAFRRRLRRQFPGHGPLYRQP